MGYKLLFEFKRDELLRKGQNEDPARYARRVNYIYTIRPKMLAKDLFIKTGTLTVPMKIGDYIVTIHLSGIMKKIRDELDSTNKTLPDRPLVYRALRKALDESEIYVDCECPDFKYRFSFWSSKLGYKYGKPETRPSKITNPNNNGYACKHITAALTNPSQWLKYVSGWIATVVKAYLQKKLSIESDEIADLDKKTVSKEIGNIKDLDNSLNQENETDDSFEAPEIKPEENTDTESEET